MLHSPQTSDFPISERRQRELRLEPVLRQRHASSPQHRHPGRGEPPGTALAGTCSTSAEVPCALSAGTCHPHELPSEQGMRPPSCLPRGLWASLSYFLRGSRTLAEDMTQGPELKGHRMTWPLGDLRLPPHFLSFPTSPGSG